MGQIKVSSRSQLVPLGNPLPNTIRRLEQVSRESSENMIYLGTRGENGITWEPVKSNDLGPTKGRLYKGLRVDKWG